MAATTTSALTSRASRYAGDALRGVRRAPVEVIATVVVATMFSRALESAVHETAFQTWWEIAVPCALLFVVAWTGTLLHAMGRLDAARRWALTACGALLVGAYAWKVVDFRYEAEAWRAGLLLGAAVAWLVAVPAFGGRGGTEGRVEWMRRVNGRFVLRVIGAVLYGAALFAGLALALAAVDNLFELHLDEETYGHVWGWIAFVLIPWIVLGGLDDYVLAGTERRIVGGAQTADLFDEATAEATSTRATSAGVATVASRIALWLVPPLLAIYTLILYAYVVRILVTREIPKNLVSPMVLVAGGLAALALLLFNPKPGRGGISRWLRLAPALFLPLVPLGYWALLVRVHQYGWTEFRMVRVAVLSTMVVLAAGASVQLARRRPFSIHAAPVMLVIVLLLSAVGPWSALALSRRSQAGALAAALAQVGIAPDRAAPRNTPVPGTPGAPSAVGETTDSSRVVPAALYERIRETARYLAGHFGRDALPVSLAALTGERPASVDYAARLGLRPDALPVREGLAIGGTLARDAPIEIGGGIAYRVAWTRGPPGEERPEGVVLPGDRSAVTVILRDDLRIELSVGNRLLRADLGPLMRELERTADPRGPGELPPEQALVPLTDVAGDRAGDFVVWSIRVYADSMGWRLQRMEGLAVMSGG